MDTADTTAVAEPEVNDIVTENEEFFEDNTQFVEIDKIDLPEEWTQRERGDEAQYQKQLKGLAVSIRNTGLLAPIGVEKKDDGRFKLCFGLRRTEAHKLLKRKLIEAKVYEPSEGKVEESANLGRVRFLSENLFRKPLTEAERIRSIQELQKHYETANPTARRGVAGAVAAKRAREIAKANENGTLATAETEANVPAPAQSFANAVAEQTGESPRTVRRLIKIGSAFSDDELAIFTAQNVGQDDMEKIAGIKDKEARTEVITLIAGGMTPELAIKRASNPETAEGETAKPRATSSDELSDDEWLKKYCNDVLKKLTFTDAFKRDALTYRRTLDARTKFKGAVKKAMAKVNGGDYTPFVATLRRLLNVSHPRHWLVCTDCNGTGQVAEGGGKCGGCKGAAYRTSTEGQAK